MTEMKSITGYKAVKSRYHLILKIAVISFLLALLSTVVMVVISGELYEVLYAIFQPRSLLEKMAAAEYVIAFIGITLFGALPEKCPQCSRKMTTTLVTNNETYYKVCNTCRCYVNTHSSSSDD